MGATEGSARGGAGLEARTPERKQGSSGPELGREGLGEAAGSGCGSAGLPRPASPLDAVSLGEF